MARHAPYEVTFDTAAVIGRTRDLKSGFVIVDEDLVAEIAMAVDRHGLAGDCQLELAHVVVTNEISPLANRLHDYVNIALTVRIVRRGPGPFGRQI